MNISLIENEQLQFAAAATAEAKRTGLSAITRVGLIHCSDSLRLIYADVGGETITHGIDLPAKAWTPALEKELIKRFKGSAELAIRHAGRAPL